MYQALYRKYRPISFDDVCGQEHITSVLKTQLQKGRVSHAYIFCGSRGTGKTTCAKILAKAVNCENLQNGEPCNECDSCKAINEERVLDVVEMDAASNNGVDHIRRLCDEAQFLPSETKKRVYIIDEVHMLSDSAFNALLKTIEEPPAHVMFILATTEMHDIPATIMSRCQRFDFKRLHPSTIADRLLFVSEKEGISLLPEAAKVLARLSDGAMRDALSLLEACQAHQGQITSELVHEMLGLGSRRAIIELCQAISKQDTALTLDLIRQIYSRIGDLKQVISELIEIYRDLLIIRSVADYKNFVEGYESELPALTEIAESLSVETILYQSKILEEFFVSYDRISTGKKAAVEMLMIRLCNESLSDRTEALLSRIAKLEKAFAEGTVVRSTPISQNATVPQEEKITSPEKNDQSKMAPSPSSVTDRRFVGSVRLKNLLQKDMFFKSFLPSIDFEKEGTVLQVVTGSFMKGVLLSSKMEDFILSCAKEVDAEITSLQFVEKDTNTTKPSSEFEGL